MSTDTDQQVPPLTLGWRLRMSLENAGIPVHEMADMIESHRTTLTRWLHDEIVPKRIYLEKWAELTGVPMAWFEEAPNFPAKPAPAQPAPTKTTPAQHKSRRRRSPSTRWDIEHNKNELRSLFASWDNPAEPAVDAAA